MRVNRYVAAATGMSRRAADAVISAGRVTVAGHTATLGQTIDPGDDVHLDSKKLALNQHHTYVLLNKPAGYISSRIRQNAGSPTLYDLLPPELKPLRIAGRLDRDSSGLILLTDDGDFLHRHTHPSFGKTKIYELTLARSITLEDCRRLEKGVQLDDGVSRVNVLKAHGRNLQVSLSEGRNRQLRRTLGALGYTIERLHRTQIGPYSIGNLPPGAWTKIDMMENQAQ